MTDPIVPVGTSVPYEEVTADTYAEAFAASCTASSIRRGVLLRGTCPRCGDQMDFPVVTEVFQKAAGPEYSPAQGISDNEPLLCTCGITHPDTPAGEEGCGAYWNITLTRPPR